MPRNLPAAKGRLLFALPLLLLGTMTGTQEPDISAGPGAPVPDTESPAATELNMEETGVPAPGFVEPPAEEPLPPSRWFRSNTAGMALEESPSRLAALRNEYALGVDYLPPAGLPELLAPRYEAPWRVEVHILYKGGLETRRQWIFRDPGGMARLVAVFDQDLLNPPAAEAPPPEEPAAEPEIEAAAAPEIEQAAEPAETETAAAPEAEPAAEEPAMEAAALAEPAEPEAAATPEAEPETAAVDEAPPETAGAGGETPDAAETAEVSETGEAAETADAAEDGGGAAEAGEADEGERPPALTGFIELYDEEGRITAEHLFRDEGDESVTRFFYRNGRLVRAELGRKDQAGNGEPAIPVYTDQYRYNRAASLRAVERTYHRGAEAASPVSLRFPHMVLNAAADKNFVDPPASFTSGFPEEYLIGEGYRVVYTTDDRGRVLTETRQDDEGTVISELANTWAGDRLSSVRLKAGDDERLTEYEYNGQGDRIIERNYRRGVLERLVRTEGNRETEELYMNGTVILRAIWEDGRKISEERVRPGS
jgi:hypothetical protein